VGEQKGGGDQRVPASTGLKNVNGTNSPFRFCFPRDKCLGSAEILRGAPREAAYLAGVQSNFTASFAVLAAAHSKVDLEVYKSPATALTISPEFITCLYLGERSISLRHSSGT
jgi:hypothetical protein